jgi:hypothetical protein
METAKELGRRLAFASASTDPHRMFFSKPGAEK